MENKKTKLTISGIAKKSIKNIEIAKTQGKNSIVIGKQSNKPHNKTGLHKQSVVRSKNTLSGRGTSSKSINTNKPPIISNDFEKRKLAEQRATKRLKGENENRERKQKLGTKKREVKLTVSRALSDEIEAKQRSLASVKRARQKENKNLTKEKGNVTVKGDLVKSAFITSTMGVSYKIKLSKNI